MKKNKKKRSDKPEVGLLYRLGKVVYLRREHYFTGDWSIPLPFGTTVVFLGFHKSSNRIAKVVVNELVGWITVPWNTKRKHQFWRKVAC